MTPRQLWGNFVLYLAAPSEAAATRMGIVGSQDRNAFAHAYTSALVIYESSRGSDLIINSVTKTFYLGYLKETVPGLAFGNEFRDFYKDMWNNSIGIDIGQYARANGLSRGEIERLVKNALQDGVLIRDDRPGVDSRIPETPTGPISSWPIPVPYKYIPYSNDKPPGCFLADTPILMADGTEKPIQDICPGDMVMSFDGGYKKGRGRLKPGRVSKTFVNTASMIINLRGLKCTPGHVFLNGEGQFEKISTILKKDGTIVDKDGVELRARTGAVVGSPEDALLNAAYDDPMRPGRLTSCLVRAGIPCPSTDGRKGFFSPYVKLLAAMGYRIENASIVSPWSSELTVPDWPRGRSPFDSDAQRNYVVRNEFGQLYTPPWIEALPEIDEELGQIRRNYSVAGAVARPN
jgi:hypothetical protein